MTTVTTDIGAASESLEVPFMPISGIQATNAQDAIQAVARASGGWLNIVMTSANVNPADTRTLYVVTGATGPFTISLPVSAVANDSVAVYMHDYTSNVIVTVDAGVSGVIADFGRTHRLGVQHTFAVYRCIAPQVWFIEWDQSTKELRYRASNATIGVVHGNSLLYMDSSIGARTVTVPSNATDPLPIGFQTEVMRYGANDVTLVADAGVIIDAESPLALPNLYSRGVLTKINLDEWTWNPYGSTAPIQKVVTTTPITPVYNDEYIFIGTTGVCTLNLPSVASRNGRPLRIKDMSGLTGHTINRNGTDVFEGGFTSFVFYTPYQGQSFIPTTIGGIKTWAVM
jgi:hypothetical protein